MPRQPSVDDDYLQEVDRAREQLRELITINNCAPLMLRLAFHDAGTYDAATNSGGPNGSIRFDDLKPQDANKGLAFAISLCEEVKKNCPRITYADLYQLAGVVAVEVSGGPKIDFVPGRSDSSVRPPEGRLPDPRQGAEHLRSVFGRMGLSDKDIVALSGAHTLGRAHRERSDFNGPWTTNPDKFDNSYFKELCKGKTEGLLRLPSDQCLVEDKAFREYVVRYAEDQELFFKDYAESHKKLSELGFMTPPKQADIEEEGSYFTAVALGIVVAAAAIVMSYWNWS